MKAKSILGSKKRSKKPEKRKGAKVSIKVKGSPGQVKSALRKITNPQDANLSPTY